MIDEEVIEIQNELSQAREGHINVDAAADIMGIDTAAEGEEVTVPTEAELSAFTQDAVGLDGHESSDSEGAGGVGEAASAFGGGFDSDSDRDDDSPKQQQSPAAVAAPTGTAVEEEGVMTADQPPPPPPVHRMRANSAMKGKSGRAKKVGGLRFAEDLVEVSIYGNNCLITSILLPNWGDSRRILSRCAPFSALLCSTVTALLTTTPTPPVGSPYPPTLRVCPTAVLNAERWPLSSVLQYVCMSEYVTHCNPPPHCNGTVNHNPNRFA